MEVPDYLRPQPHLTPHVHSLDFPFRFAFALIFSAALRLAAQDVTVNRPSWVDPNDPPDQLPVIKMDTPDYPERLDGSTEIGYIVIDTFIFSDGKDFTLQRSGTNAEIHGLFIGEKSKWRIEPAARNGNPVNSMVRQTIIFNPACADSKIADATPRLLSVVVPEMPSGLAKSNDLPAKLYVAAGDEASGQGTKPWSTPVHPISFMLSRASTPPGRLPTRWLTPARPRHLGNSPNAVLKWRFAPARKNGQPVAQDVRVPVVFLKPYSIDVNADTPPHVIHKARIIYPPEMRGSQQRGLVKLRFLVDIEGRARNVVVVSSNNPGFNQAAIDAIAKYRFEPGRRNGVPVNTHLNETINFFFRGPATAGHDAYDVSGDSSDQSKLPPELRYDIPPKPGQRRVGGLSVRTLARVQRRRHGGGKRFLVNSSGGA